MLILTFEGCGGTEAAVVVSSWRCNSSRRYLGMAGCPFKG